MDDMERQMSHFEFGLEPVAKLVARSPASFKVNPKGARPYLLRVWTFQPHGQLTAISETDSLRSLRAVPFALASSVGVPSITNRYW